MPLSKSLHAGTIRKTVSKEFMLTERKGGLRNAIRQGFSQLPENCTAVQYYYQGNYLAELPKKSRIITVPDQQNFALVLPTFIGRCEIGVLWDNLQTFGENLEILKTNYPSVFPFFVLAFQYEHTDQLPDCLEYLRKLERLWSQEFTLPFLAIVCTPKSKILAVNTCVKHIAPLDVELISWVDDDIYLDSDCLSKVYSHYRPHDVAIYGARKMTIEGNTSFSKKWADHKNTIEPVNLYPHGCCILISRKEFGQGIPVQYMTDDHYFLFKYLEPNQKNPLRRLQVIEDALLFCPTASSPLQTLRRIRRNYRNVLRILADAHPDTIRYFLRDLMFPAISPPASFREIFVRSYWRKMFWHLLKFVFWLSCVIPQVVRGMIRLPKSTFWYSADFSTKKQQ